MGNDKEAVIAALHRKFIGKILSAFTHEVNNHLAILKESAGLAGDMLSSQKASQQLQDISKIMGSIESQIGKTSWLIKNLNSFSHRMDNPLSSFSLNESIEEILTLLNRVISRKEIILEKDFKENIPLIHSNPSNLQFIIFRFLDYALKRLDKNGIITLKTDHLNGSAIITLVLKGDIIAAGNESPSAHDIYRHILSQLDGSFSLQEKELTITIPVIARQANNF